MADQRVAPLARRSDPGSGEGLKLAENSESSSRRDGKGLLSSVLADGEVRQKFVQMSADEKTVTICSLAGGELQHPSWRQSWEDVADSETTELSGEASEKVVSQSEQGFVPSRLLAQLTEKMSGKVDYRLVGRLGSGGTGVV